MNYTKKIAAIAMLALVGVVHAAGGSESTTSSAVTDPYTQKARVEIAKKDWEAAQTILKKALVDHPNNADYHNLYAYSVRKSAKPNMDVVFSHYGQALRIDPKHRGAHEYIGEAYLQVGNLPKAKEHLAALDRLCMLGCEEYSDLKSAIAKYEVDHPR